MPEPTLQDAFEKIAALESQIAELKGFRVVKSVPRKPVNAAAWRKAMDARIYGKDRGKAEREYEKFYAVPDLTLAASLQRRLVIAGPRIGGE